jgi:hypothetical protein
VDNTSRARALRGVVIAKAAAPGEIVSPLSAGGGFTRTGIGTIVDMDSLEVEVDVSEAYIGRVQPKMPVEAVLNAYPDWRIPAEVIAIIPTADRAKATVKVRIALKSKDPRIVPGHGRARVVPRAGRQEGRRRWRRPRRARNCPPPRCARTASRTSSSSSTTARPSAAPCAWAATSATTARCWPASAPANR